jgi:hypothetical protein
MTFPNLKRLATTAPSDSLNRFAAARSSTSRLQVGASKAARVRCMEAGGMRNRPV